MLDTHRTRVRTKAQKERKAIFNQLKKDPNDPEARRWLKKHGISYVKLSVDGKTVEVRI